MRKKMRKFNIIFLGILFILFTNLPVYAEVGPIGVVGPGDQDLKSEPVGPIGIVGNNSNVGPKEPVGRQQNATENNQATGANSENINQTNANSNSSIDSTDTTNVENTAALDINSGKNSIDQNTSVESLSTGDIDGSVSIINLSGSKLSPESSVSSTILDGNSLSSLSLLQNQNDSAGLLLPTYNQSNGLTGANSLNTNTLDQRNVVSFINDELTDFKNQIGIIADTGNNDITRNTQIGSIRTGDIGLNVNLINLKHIISPDTVAQIDLFTILNGLRGDIVIPLINKSTGPNSGNINNVNSTNSVESQQSNNTSIDNTFDFQVNTGENTLASNTQVGDIASGETKVGGSVLNIIDNPVYYIINVFGRWIGRDNSNIGDNYVINELGNQDGSSSNTVTGSNSDNENIINSENTTVIDSNNNTTVDNKIHVAANTGRNNLSGNSVINNVTTGAINILANVVNSSGAIPGNLKNLQIRIINIYGDWIGNLTNKEKTELPLSETSQEPDNISPMQSSLKTASPVSNRPIAESAKIVRNQLTSTEKNIKNPNVYGLSNEDNAETPEKNNTNPRTMLIIPATLAGAWGLIELILRKIAK
ncbi:MAG: hypothetical protein WC107_06860 [Patescibacteria group bacterium]